MSLPLPAFLIEALPPWALARLQALVEVDLAQAFPLDALTYLRYFGGFSLRYIIICGGIFWILYRRNFANHSKIQPHEPTNSSIIHEILWSVSNTVCTGLAVLLMYWLIEQGHTQIYSRIDEHGWTWFFASMILGTIGFDTWFYWLHRTLHTPLLFRHGHIIHHKVTNPTPFAAFAHHPIETFGEDLYFILLIMVIPMHPLAFGLVGFHAFILGVLGHMGFEFFPRWFVRHRLFGLHNTSTHHNMHHSHVGGNYSLYFNWWDRLMGTNLPGYADYFEEVTARRDRLRAEKSTLRA